MKVIISRDKKGVVELEQVEVLHASKWGYVVVTYLNSKTKPVNILYGVEEWDTIIINKKG